MSPVSLRSSFHGAQQLWTDDSMGGECLLLRVYVHLRQCVCVPTKCLARSVRTVVNGCAVRVVRVQASRSVWCVVRPS